MKVDRPDNFGTIAGLIYMGQTLRAHCRNLDCRHPHQFDLEALAARLGLHHSTMHDDLTPKLRCSKCGSKRIGLISTTGGK